MPTLNDEASHTAPTLCIIGAGGFGREVYSLFRASLLASGAFSDVVFAEEDAHHQPRDVGGVRVLALSKAAQQSWSFVIAIGSAQVRRRIAEMHPGLNYATIIHPSAIIGDGVELGAGSIVCACSILTSDIRVGRHAHLNLATTIGHDTVAGHYLTTAPSTHISGHCRLGDAVYLGSSVVLRQGITLGSDVTIGAGAVVLHDTSEAGTYVGVPARRVR